MGEDTLPKDTPCFEQECAFTTSEGAWPFDRDVPSAPTEG
jgi:hypothetical protein